MPMRFPKATKKSKGGAALAFPDVCKVPAPPAPFVPVPYPNIAQIATNLKTASVKVKGLEKQMSKVKSTGDEAGTLKGVLSHTSKIKTLLKTHSINVKVTGKKASRLDPASMSKAGKVHKEASKQQKAVEKKLKRECDEILKACKGKPELEQIAKKVIDTVGKATRGHKV